MKTILCAHFPHWPIDRAARRSRQRASHEQRRDAETRGHGDAGKREKEQGTTAGAVREVPSQPNLSTAPAACSSLSASPRPRVSASYSPRVLIRTVADRQLVMAVSDAAAAAGIRRGMTLTQARALCADVAHGDYQPDRDRQALEALGRWMMQFSPVVALGAADEEEDLFPVARAPRTGKSTVPQQQDDALFLDITGCDRVFDGFENLIRRLSDSLRRLGLRARVAAAPTPGAAWALAVSGKDGVIIEQHQTESALGPLPIEALRIGDDACAALHHLGLHTIGQVMHLPREVLPARFGPLLLRRIDQALGWVAEPLVPLEYRTPVEARLDWDGAVGSLEAVWSAFQSLIGQVIEQLTRRGQGARRVEFELLRLHSPAVKKTIFLSRPSRDPVNLFNLFRCAIEDLQLPVRERSRLRGKRLGSVRNVKRDDVKRDGRCTSSRSTHHVSRDPLEATPVPTSSVVLVKDSQICDEGFSGMRISVPLCERLTDEQITLLGSEQYAGQMELDRLIERLRVRIGGESVFQPELIETYVPEGAWARSDAGAGTDAETRRHGDAGKEKRKRNAPFGSFSAPPRSRVPASHSPLCLLPAPAEVRVMVTPSEDAEGQPAAFTHEGTARRVVHCVGPERIAGRWWDGHDKTRDYFDVADATGRRFWIFRVGETGRWYLHGAFE